MLRDHRLASDHVLLVNMATLHQRGRSVKALRRRDNQDEQANTERRLYALKAARLSIREWYQEPMWIDQLRRVA